MISVWGIDHGETVSKLSGYDYDDEKRGYTVATRVGYTSSKTPYGYQTDAAKFTAKKAGKLRVADPHSWKRANRQARSRKGYDDKINSFKGKDGTYSDAVWEHKHSKAPTSYTSGGGGDFKPFTGNYKRFNRNYKGVSDAVAT